MIRLPEAQALILDATQPMSSCKISLDEAANHIAAEDIISKSSVSPFRNSAMDGFAFASESVNSCPATLDIFDSIFAGDNPTANFDRAKAVKIMTGAPLPEAYDTVVKVEETTYDNKTVTINSQIKRGQNVRLPGEDISIDETVIKKNSLIRSLDIGILASIGLNKVSVISKPRILILSTGDELAKAGEPLEFGQIYDSNSYTIDALTKNFRASVEKQAAVGDDVGSLKRELNSDHDVIITTGGVSMGEKDLLPKVAEDCGWQPLLHKVAIKPGKPIFVAKRNQQILFGLPGNPLSAAVTCAIMVLPALKKMVGIKNCLPDLTDAILTEPVSIRGGRTLVWPGKITYSTGPTEVTLAEKRSSAALSALLRSDGLIIISQTESDLSQQVQAVRWQKLLTL